MVNKPWLIRSSSRITICYQLCFEKETGTLSTLSPCEASIFNLVPKKCLKNIYEVVALPKIWTKKLEKFCPKLFFCSYFESFLHNHFTLAWHLQICRCVTTIARQVSPALTLTETSKKILPNQNEMHSNAIYKIFSCQKQCQSEEAIKEFSSFKATLLKVR